MHLFAPSQFCLSAIRPQRTCSRFISRAAPSGIDPKPATPTVKLLRSDPAFACRQSATNTALLTTAQAPAVEYKDVGPAPRRFTVAEGQAWELAGASAGTVFRLGAGLLVHGYKSGLVEDDGKYTVMKVSGRKLSETTEEVSNLKRPTLPIELFEFEACPYCRKVREAICVLDLDVLVRPCPKGGPTYRPQVLAKGGKSQFPFLVDPNTGRSLYESDEIIAYLFKEYGPGEEAIPWMLRPGVLTNISAALSALPRMSHGRSYRAARQPAQPLVLWGYEPSPFVKLVREKMSELELTHTYITAARGSSKRQALLDKRGAFQVPYLEDPNEGVYMFESSAIIKYLDEKYALPA